jgi:hypothetical protein
VPFAPGENLHVSWSPEALVLLPPD